MNIDIRLSLDFFDHPKTKKLSKRLGLEGVFSLLKLWSWVSGNRSTGILTSMDAEDVELAADWGGEDGLFVQTLLALRLLDENEGVYAIHDWEDHQAYASKSEERSSKSRKAAEARWNKATEVPSNTDSNAQRMPGDATSNAQRMPGDATSNAQRMPGNACPAMLRAMPNACPAMLRAMPNACPAMLRAMPRAWGSIRLAMPQKPKAKNQILILLPLTG